MTNIKWLILYIIKFLYLLLGLGWNSFYTLVLNRQERKNSFNHIKNLKHKTNFWALNKGHTMLDFLKKNGLKANSSFLDFGCGYGRVGIPLIKYLDTEKYVGLDLSHQRIRLAREYILEEGVTNKNYDFHVSLNKSLKELLGNKKFDFILLYSVICHNPLQEAKNILKELKPFMNKDGKLLFDYQNANENNKNDYFTSILGFKIKYSVKDYRFYDYEIENILLELGYRFEVLEDFENYSDNKVPNPYRKMLMLSCK